MSDRVEIVLVAPPAAKRTGRPRVVTRELAEALAEVLLSDPTHTIESASVAVGLKSSTVRELLSRYHRDKSTSPEDEEIGAILDAAKTEHLRKIRAFGFSTAAGKNISGVTWAKWQLEVQDPVNHPRKTEQSVELSGPGGAPMQTQGETTLKYVVMVPPAEAPDEE